jgi:hypothetical protein
MLQIASRDAVPGVVQRALIPADADHGHDEGSNASRRAPASRQCKANGIFRIRFFLHYLIQSDSVNFKPKMTQKKTSFFSTFEKNVLRFTWFF